ncbi:MAG: alternate-type signal peptide domain-containing protein [Actinobacteria bacterium]|uniref:Unannotated protein n=1 Tax=freshwater metagenome TaxID=449393 RepID=A0A6J6RC17_9ZZZZ|nr:alternate-type signal peptide domain-containing protein [Actinomycetota bacterium]
MRKELKGTIALAGAAAVLVGGGGTLAYWNATGTLTGPPAVESGELKLLNASCGAGTGWVFDAGEVTNAHAYVSGDKLVPGDVLTKVCTFDIVAVGEHLRATATASGGAGSGPLSSSLILAPSFTIGGASASSITEANNGQVLQATMTVTFTGASTNSTQALAAALSDYVVTLQQVHS